MAKQVTKALKSSAKVTRVARRRSRLPVTGQPSEMSGSGRLRKISTPSVITK